MTKNMKNKGLAMLVCVMFVVGMLGYQGVEVYGNQLLTANVYKAIPTSKTYTARSTTDILKLKTECDVNFTVDYNTLLGTNETYNKELSKFTEILATNMYTPGAIIHLTGEDEQIYNAENLDSDPVTLFKALDMQDIQYIKTEEYSELNKTDKNDNTRFICGHKYIESGGKKYDISVVSFSGSDGTIKIWGSNLDVGADMPEYYEKTGEHPFWKNKAHHKGFDIAANKAMTLLDSTCLNNIDQNAEKIILICGHSRGAAVANLVGKAFEDREDFKSFTYTFASPNTTDGDIGNYKTIFNIVNSDDVATYLPSAKWGFKKYGTTKEISVKKEYSSSSKAEGSWESFTNRSEYVGNECTCKTIEAVLNCIKNRAAFYGLKQKPADPEKEEEDDPEDVDPKEEEKQPEEEKNKPTEEDKLIVTKEKALTLLKNLPTSITSTADIENIRLVRSAYDALTQKDKQSIGKSLLQKLQRAEINAYKATISATTVTYTGKKLKPVVTLQNLKENKDFKVTYTHNKNIGIATANIKGIRDNNFSFGLNFKIIKKTLKSNEVKLVKNKVKINNLKVGRDFNVKYNRKAKVIIVKVVGKNNCKGTVKKTFRRSKLKGAKLKANKTTKVAKKFTQALKAIQLGSAEDNEKLGITLDDILIHFTKIKVVQGIMDAHFLYTYYLIVDKDFQSLNKVIAR